MPTTADVARLLDCTQQHVQRLCKGGLVDAEKRGRDWYVSPEWVAALAAMPPSDRRKAYFRRPRGGRTETTWPKRGEPCRRCGTVGTGGPCEGC